MPGWRFAERLLMPPRTQGASNRARGDAAERAVARYLRDQGYPLAGTARAAMAGLRKGEDIVGIPGVSLEVKNRRDVDLSGSLRQAVLQAGPDKLPVVIIKPYGVGLDSVGDWFALNYVRHQVPLWPKEGQL
jgi:hypothetical protein